MAISTNPKPTIYRNLYENKGGCSSQGNFPCVYAVSVYIHTYLLSCSQEHGRFEQNSLIIRTDIDLRNLKSLFVSHANNILYLNKLLRVYKIIEIMITQHLLKT